jgi:mRNA interferase RelE/StbE
MPYEILLKRSAERELATLPGNVHDRIVERINHLGTVPRPHGSARLRGHDGYRIRVGDYRVLYVVEDARRRVVIVAVGHRRDVYR